MLDCIIVMLLCDYLSVYQLEDINNVRSGGIVLV